MGFSSADKARFFFDLFRCRTDVYALRWESSRWPSRLDTDHQGRTLPPLRSEVINVPAAACTFGDSHCLPMQSLVCAQTQPVRSQSLSTMYSTLAPDVLSSFRSASTYFGAIAKASNRRALIAPTYSTRRASCVSPEAQSSIT